MIIYVFIYFIIVNRSISQPYEKDSRADEVAITIPNIETQSLGSSPGQRPESSSKFHL